MSLALYGGKAVRDTQIHYGKQYIDDDDIRAVVEVLKGPLITCGPKVEELERKLCFITEGSYSTVLSSGTAALHAACYAAGITHGDEVITSPMTFAASANCIFYVGGKPIFADINPKTYNIDPYEIKKNITAKTKAVIAVDFTGQAVELDEIKQLCKERNITLIEDGSHSIGTQYRGKPIGSIADMTTFSFHPVKTVTGGEGGAVMTNNEDFYKKTQLFRSHGITRNGAMLEYEPHGPWYYEQIDLGYNYRMTDIQAALLISQLDKLEMFSSRRKEIVRKYDEAFSNMNEIIIQEQIPESNTTRHLYLLNLNLDRLTTDRKGIFNALWAENICCNVHYIPVYYFPYYEKLGYKKGICPNAEKLYESIISLPIYYSMTDNDVDDVINGVQKIINHFSRK